MVTSLGIATRENGLRSTTSCATEISEKKFYEVEIEEIQAIANPENGNRLQVILVKARMPAAVARLKEAAQFYHNRHETV